ncbi:MAG: hypothetical protein AAF768_12660 [Pseudomonadota bacterium]
MLRVLSLVASLGSLAACGAPPPSTGGIHTLSKGESILFEIPANEPKLISFSIVFDSPSWDAADDCPEQDVGTDDTPFMMRICGGVYSAEENNANYASGQHGAGISFSPVDGLSACAWKTMPTHKWILS